MRVLMGPMALQLGDESERGWAIVLETLLEAELGVGQQFLQALLGRRKA
jgi:hypothetical protein